MKALFLLMAFIGIAFNASAEDKIFLYGDYYYGMSRAEFFKTGSAHCKEFADDVMVCNRENIDFANGKWIQFFEFGKQGLFCVAFWNHATLENANAVMSWFDSEDYLPLEANAGSGSVNFSLLYDENRIGEFLKENKQFNSALPSAPNFNARLIKISTLREYKAMGKLPGKAPIAILAGSKPQGVLYVGFELATIDFEEQEEQGETAKKAE